MYLPKTSNEAVLEAVGQFDPAAGECVMILFAEKHDADIPALIDSLNEQQIIFFGGVFPGVIYRDQGYEQGAVLKKFKYVHPPTLIRDLSQPELNDLNKIEISGKDQIYTAVLLLDGITTGINAFLERINNRMGDKVNFLGAGAGSLSFVQQPCIFTPEGFFQDAAICCIIDAETVLGVRHGWEQLAGPLVATRTERNQVFELNWENAFDVYKKVVEADCGCAIQKDNFLDIAKSYPLGILREGAEDIVRDPISVGPEGELICIGEVPSNTVLHILKGNSETLIASAKMVADDCLQQLDPPVTINHTLVVDCISRSLFLEQEYTQELQAIQQQIPLEEAEQQIHGVLSMGEISSYGAGTLEFFNKTIVVGLVKAES